jgi:hypothetical protein
MMIRGENSWLCTKCGHHEPAPSLLAEIGRLRAALIATMDELDRWGWGDFHYGSQPQDQRVVDAVAKANAVLDVSAEPQP